MRMYVNKAHNLISGTGKVFEYTLINSFKFLYKTEKEFIVKSGEKDYRS